MKAYFSNKAAGYYFVLIACILGLISCVRFQLWGMAAGTADTITLALLILGVVLSVVLLVRDMDWLVIAASTCYMAAAAKIVTDNVGSFVDYIQGINLFGDASQVSNIISISAVIAVGALLSIIASFLRRVKA